jgi:glycosyltransferase involved in cell wall biosynthesis
MPVYNEEGAIALAIQEVQRHVLDRVSGAELVVVNDGSRDGTGRLLDQIAGTDPRIHAIHQENRGHGGALMTGLARARGEFVFLIDSDRQILLDDFGTAWAHAGQGRDGVFGVRRRRHDPALRLYLSKMIAGVVRMMFGVRLLDANVPYKLLRRSIWQDASRCIPAGTLAPSLFLAIFARKRGHDIVEVDVVHKERETGEVSIRRWKLLKFCATGLRQMLAFRKCLGAPERPRGGGLA